MTDKPQSPLAGSKLGYTVDYPQQYDPSLLFPVDRQINRSQLHINGWNWAGFDLWYAYELSWLNARGLPQVALGRFLLPADSPCIIESKSLKLYLNSFNMSRFADREEVQSRLQQDLSAVAQAPVQVELLAVDTDLSQQPGTLAGALCLDSLPVEIDTFAVAPELLQLRDSGTESSLQVREVLYSHLLRSNCPVTGQPDWGSLVIDYEGPALDHEAVLRYLVSFRTHTEFHEHCVERIFTDILALGEFRRLLVRAHYTRRGGLDINPCRSLSPELPDMGRWTRQ
ncbi:MAG: NADPH-dependent 7-cyano-7-deazaguanine reductase QueF [Natronospirillum sp.]|uniref:NADPH-dependent 7-cyano-7-deazaguanine reductase QueF n=1 Tax=Natronospirillum sp. TaxID=2812955 RepID=UPI0025F59413|nr:NADPH-dependent 7-cyano-7-deazaguanine reductase QueF [Natronospirillum sp.]MCH8553122.1 NADPH-dependent 7-cyano-7-deazaguanine reductase QueF [Natronospirillum sp.]